MERNEAINVAFHGLKTLNFLNEFLYALRDTPQQSISSFFEQWQRSFSWHKIMAEPYALLNTDVLLIHLYALVIVPQQTFIDNIPDVPLNSLSTEIWGSHDIRLWPNDRPKTLRNFLRVLRNAVAHGRVSADQQCRFIFQDQINENSPPHSVVAINHSDLYKFEKALADGYVLGKWA